METDPFIDATPSQRQAEKLLSVKWSKGGDTPCPMCDSTDWGISPPLFFPVWRQETPSSLALAVVADSDAPGIPFVPVTCNTCGNTIFIPVPPVGDFPGLEAEGQAD